MKYFGLLFLLFVVAALPAQDALSEEPAYYIKSIYFGGGSYYIDDLQIQELGEFLEQFEPIEQYEFSIQSHTDNIGSAAYNNWLSQMRGEAVKLEIINWGIPPELLSNKDFGEFAPAFNNDTWEGKIRNRRVDVIVRRIVI